MTTNVKLIGNVSKKYAELFGNKTVNGKTLNVEEVIGIVCEEVNKFRENALNQRRIILESKTPVKEKYRIPEWNEEYQDPVTGEKRNFRQIVQGLIDNFLGNKTDLAWRLNDRVPIPEFAHPLKNPGLELTGPWSPADMAIKQINADVAATMGPDDEDAAPPDYVPYKSANKSSIGLFESRLNEKKILSGQLMESRVVKKGSERTYKLLKPMEEWPTSFHRIPGIHLLTENVKVNGKPAPSFVVDLVIHALNDYESLKKAGRMLLYYVPKTQTPLEAAVIARAVWKIEQIMGAEKPGSFIKFKALYEEGNGGRYLPVIMWIWRYWLIGTNVGRWDYTASLIEMWKNERALPDPQNGQLMGMTSPHMMAYQRYNALLNLMAGLKDGEFTNAAPIGGMAAVMLYSKSDIYGRFRHNAVTLRAMKLDKLRERLIGLIFVPYEDINVKVTLEDVIKGRYKGKLYDTYRQSWVATPDEQYVAAGNVPLRAKVEELQAMLDAPEVWEKVDGNPVAPKLESGLTADERKLLNSLGLLDENGRITPWVIPRNIIDSPEKFISESLWKGKDLWNSLYNIPEGDITVENIQHAFYMAANYGFQVLNGNLAAAIDDYRAFANRLVRFMNDLATYRIFVSWLWSLANLRARVTKDGYIKGPKLTQDGILPSANIIEVKTGMAFDKEMFDRIWNVHNEWTEKFYNDYDRLTAMRLLFSAMVIKGNKSLEDSSQLIDKALMSFILKQDISDEETVKGILTALKIENFRGMVKLTKKLGRITEIISLAYGKPPSYKKRITYYNAARRIARITGLKVSSAREIIEVNAPMFDRSEAPVIMDILRRQVLSPKYIQHSARVLFMVAGRSEVERKKLLDAIYYLDSDLNPVYRNEKGEPSRDKIEEAVRTKRLPKSVLDMHDYIYDIY